MSLVIRHIILPLLPTPNVSSVLRGLTSICVKISCLFIDFKAGKTDTGGYYEELLILSFRIVILFTRLNRRCRRPRSHRFSQPNVESFRTWVRLCSLKYFGHFILCLLRKVKTSTWWTALPQQSHFLNKHPLPWTWSEISKP